MEKVGLIGYGNWGKLLYKKINVFADVGIRIHVPLNAFVPTVTYIT